MQTFGKLFEISAMLLGMGMGLINMPDIYPGNIIKRLCFLVVKWGGIFIGVALCALLFALLPTQPPSVRAPVLLLFWMGIKSGIWLVPKLFVGFWLIYLWLSIPQLAKCFVELIATRVAEILSIREERILEELAELRKEIERIDAHR